MARKNQQYQQNYTAPTVRIERPPWKVYITAGTSVVSIVAIVVAVVAFWSEIRLILLAIAGIIAGGGVLWVRATWSNQTAAIEERKHERAMQRRLQLAAVIKAEAEAAKAQNEADYMMVERNKYLYNTRDGRVTIEAHDQVVPGQARQLPEGEQRRLMAMFQQFIHWLLIGPTQTGKTTLMNHLIDAYESSTIIYVGDPHSKFNIWSTRAEVVGRGRDFVAVADLIARVWQLMDDRYRGDDLSFERVVLVIDEWPSVVAGTPTPQETSRYLRELARESAKANIRLILGSQGDTVGDLGTEGHAQVKENFVRVRLSHSLRQRNEGVIIDSEDGKETVTLAGPYYPQSGGRFFSRSQQQALRLPPPPEPEPSEDDLLFEEFRRLVIDERVLRKDACQEIYGRPYSGELAQELAKKLKISVSGV